MELELELSAFQALSDFAFPGSLHGLCKCKACAKVDSGRRLLRLFLTILFVAMNYKDAAKFPKMIRGKTCLQWYLIG